MLIRLALEADFPEIAAMGRANIEETCPHIGFDEATVWDTMRQYLKTASPTFFIAEKNGQIAGFLLADMRGYRASTGHEVVCEVLYVKPAYRGSRAAAHLLKHAEAWARRLGAKELIAGVDNNFQPERTAKFMEHLGFARVGYALTKRLQDG